MEKIEYAPSAILISTIAVRYANQDALASRLPVMSVYKTQNQTSAMVVTVKKTTSL